MVLMLPKLRARSPAGARSPLASVIGSGFLVIGPVLARMSPDAGRSRPCWAQLRAGLAVRFGDPLQYRRPRRMPGTPRAVKAASDQFARWDRMSQLLAQPWPISRLVAYYLNLQAPIC
ncbi:MAG: hypothetical protein R3F01_11785 [Lysobacteraceae bacterium]